jgi:hypothetical protein
MISLYDRGDVEMRAAKNGADFPDVRWNSNNSEVWGTEPLSDLQLLQQMVEMFAGERGEPGIFSRRAAKFTLPTRRKWCPDFGVNPCQPDFATLLTPDGIRTMGQLDVGDTVWSGKRWTQIVRKVCTGVKRVYKYTTSAGSFIGTENHRVVENGRKVEVRDAVGIDSCPTLDAAQPSQCCPITAREDLGEMPVYDITVDADEHTYWTGGLLVSNCGEIILRPYRKHLVLGCGKAVAGGLRSEKAAFARHTTSVIARVTCRRCIHEWGVQIRPKDPPPPPKPVFNDPWSSEDAPLGATQWPKNGSN